MPRCTALKHSVSIGPNATVRPCCSWDNNNGKETDFGDDFRKNHSDWDKLMAGDDWLPECRECQVAEQGGNSSLRNYFNNLLSDSTDIEYWDFKINNTCNLACRMCGPHSSSTWDQIAKQIDPQHKAKTTKWHKNIDDIMHELYAAKHVKFTGGEPFLIPQVSKLVKFLVDQDIAPAIELSFITNGTQDLGKYYHLLSSFKHVNITISIDAVGERFEYIRSGANWNQVSQNIININNNKPSNVKLAIACLPQALNVNHMHEVEQWCKQNKIGFYRATECIDPDYMSPGALDNPALRQKLIDKMKVLDKIHGTNYREFI